MQYSLKMNCRIVDACFRLHNCIVEHRIGEKTMTGVERDVFDDDCRRFFATHPEIREGIHGGEEDIRRDGNGNPERGGRPLRSETNSSSLGKEWRDTHCQEINRQQLCRPRTNWYRERNRMFND